MVGLIRAFMRAQALLQSPHLLRHVQGLTLQGWDVHDLRKAISAQYFSTEDDSHNVTNTVDAGNMFLAIYDLISRLVLHMPRLQELELEQSPMTPLFFAAISSRPQLTFLSISLCFAEYLTLHEQSHPIYPPRVLHLREVHFHNIWAETSGDEYLSHILAGCIMTLHTLSIPSLHLPLVTAHIDNRVLPLKTLRVEFGFGSRETSAEYAAYSTLWYILRSTPELRTLSVDGGRLCFTPPDDLRDHLGTLCQLRASRMIVQKLAEGRELEEIQVDQTDEITEVTISQIIPCSPTHLRELAVHSVKPKSQQELDQFIGSFHEFQSLHYLSITYHFCHNQATDVDFHVRPDQYHSMAMQPGSLLSLLHRNLGKWSKIFGGNLNISVASTCIT